VRYMRMFDMTNDSHLFKRRDVLDADGFYPVGGNVWRKGNEAYMPLYVGRMIHQYDHRAANVEVNEENLHNPALSGNITLEQKRNVNFLPIPQYWLPANQGELSEKIKWTLGFRDIARATDARTLIMAVIPSGAAGNTLPLLIPNPGSDEEYRYISPLFLANSNSFVTDYIVRQKVQSTHVNWYIL